MSDEKQQCRRKWIKLIFFKIPIVLMIVGAVLIGALKMVERHPNPLRQGFEQYLSRVTGGNAIIGSLEEIKFFPNFIVHAKNITVHNRQNAAIVDLKVEEFYISSPFSSVFFNSKKINKFFIKNLKANKGVFGVKDLYISSAEIITKKGPDQFGSFLVFDGTIGGEDSYFEMEIDAGKYSYKIPSSILFSLRIGKYEVNATFKQGFRSTMLTNTVFVKNNKMSDAHKYMLVHKKEFNIDNPLTCILNQNNLKKCDKYLNVESEIEN